jgi:hypothetical protein
MKKTLLIAAAALAAGVISSQAQVYSQNIVGYVNVSLQPGFTFLSNPLDSQSGGVVNNAATNVISNPFNSGTQSGPLDGSQLLLWNGVGYNTYYFDSNPGDTTTGFTDSNGNPLPTPTLSSGVGFYINNVSTGTNQVTIVGAVRGTTGTAISTTNVIPNQAFTFVGSGLPIGGDIETNLMLSNPFNATTQSGPLDGSKVLIPNYNAAGILVSYTTYVFDSNTGDTTTGFTDNNGNPLPAPIIPVGGAFFFNNNANTTINWVQNLAQ